MIWPLRKRKSSPEAVRAIYSAIVAQSRQEVFYAECGIPDTVTGRFDMICLHLGLVCLRLKGEVPDFAEDLVGLFFGDMDRSLREMGVGDLSVPKRMQKMGSAFYGLLGRLAEPVARRDSAAVADILDHNFFAGENPEAAIRLARYALALADHFSGQSIEAIAGGAVSLGVRP